ncbi:MAG: hypothetical protein U1E65_22080 [Myxococcota bacterium]
MLSVFLALAVGVPDQVIDVHETVPLPLFVRVVPGVRPSVGSLDLVDALDRAFRSATMLRVVEVGQECGSELGCIAKQAAAGTARFGIAVFSGSRGNDVALVDLAVLRELVAGGSQDLLTDILRRAVLESAAQGTFNRVEELDQDATAFLQATRVRLSEAGLWARPAEVTLIFSGATPRLLVVNGSTTALGAGAHEVRLSGLWPRPTQVVAQAPWAAATARFDPSTGELVTVELPYGPGRTTGRVLLGGGLASAAAGIALFVAVGASNAAAPPIHCLQVSSGINEKCTSPNALVGVGGGLAGLGVGALVASFLDRDEAVGTPTWLDVLLLGVGASFGAAGGVLFEVLQ